jgi:FkbM family methyltransferase
MTGRSKPLSKKILRGLSEPFIGLRKLWQIHVVKDPRILAYRAWKKANRDKDLRFDYALGPESVVVDLGGYLGDFAQEIHDKFGAQVYLYEPSLVFHGQCVERFRNVPNVHCYAFGLGASDRQLTLTDDADASSMVDEKTAEITGETVQIRRFADVIKELGLARIDLLKINIEGGEFEVLPHLIETGLIDMVGDIQVQFHDFVTDAVAQRDAIRQALAATHECTWDYEFVWENWTRKG